MKLALVSPPCIRPTSPPLGPAVLASYLGKHLPSVQVRTFDLNLLCHQRMLQGMKEGVMKLHLYDWDEDTTAMRVDEAQSFIRSDWGPESDLGRYHREATILLSFENIMGVFMSEMASRALFGIPIPGRIEAFFRDLIRPVVEYRPDMVGISVLFYRQMLFAAHIAGMIRQETCARVVLGGAGIGVMSRPGRILEEPWERGYEGRTFRMEPGHFFDYLIPGEGERSLLQLCKAGGERDLSGVPNLVRLRNGKLEENPPEVIDDLAEIPEPDFSDLPLDKYLVPEIVLPVLFSRGCPWGKCSFCTHHRSYLRYRPLPIDECLRQLKVLRERHGTRLFSIYDEMIPPERFRRLARAILDEGLEIRYSAYAKPTRQFDADLLGLIRRSGCHVIMWGVESASQRVLDLMGKGTRVEDMKKVLERAGSAGIMNLIFVMFGFPTETRDEFFETIAFLDRNRKYIHAISKGVFILTEGSMVERMPEKFSITKISAASGPPETSLKYDVSRGLSPGETEALYRDNRKFFDGLGLSPRFGAYREHLLSLGFSKGNLGK